MYKERISRTCVLISANCNAKVEGQNALRKHSADYKIESLNYIAIINSLIYLKSQIRKRNRGKIEKKREIFKQLNTLMILSKYRR